MLVGLLISTRPFAGWRLRLLERMVPLAIASQLMLLLEANEESPETFQGLCSHRVSYQPFDTTWRPCSPGNGLTLSLTLRNCLWISVRVRYRIRGRMLSTFDSSVLSSASNSCSNYPLNLTNCYQNPYNYLAVRSSHRERPTQIEATSSWRPGRKGPARAGSAYARQWVDSSVASYPGQGPLH